MADNGWPAAAQADVIDILLQQHAAIEELFVQALASTGRPRQATVETLARLLVMHEAIEEEIVHPIARSVADEGDAVVQARRREEESSRQLLQALTEIDVNSVEFDALLVSLRSAVLAHARREERYEFGYLRQKLGADSLRRMAEVARAAGALVPDGWQSPVESGIELAVVGPPLAAADQIRDAPRRT